MEVCTCTPYVPAPRHEGRANEGFACCGFFGNVHFCDIRNGSILVLTPYLPSHSPLLASSGPRVGGSKVACTSACVFVPRRREGLHEDIRLCFAVAL